MSRQFIPPLMAIIFGVATGYYTFQPAFKDLQIEKARSQGPGSSNPPAEHQPAPASTSSSKDNGDGK